MVRNTTRFDWLRGRGRTNSLDGVSLTTGRPSGPNLFSGEFLPMPQSNRARAPIRSSIIEVVLAAWMSFVIYGCSAQAPIIPPPPPPVQPAPAPSPVATVPNEMGPPKVTTASFYGPGTTGPRHQQWRGLQSACDDGGLAHAAHRIACEGDQSQDRQIGGGEDQRSRSVREGTRDRFVARRGKTYRDRPSRSRESKGDARRGGSVQWDARLFGARLQRSQIPRMRLPTDSTRRRESSGGGVERDPCFTRLRLRPRPQRLFRHRSKRKSRDRRCRSLLQDTIPLAKRAG